MSNVIYINDMARMYHAALNAVDKDVYLVHSKLFDNVYMTLEAYETCKGYMSLEDFETHTAVPFAASCAALLTDEILVEARVLDIIEENRKMR